MELDLMNKEESARLVELEAVIEKDLKGFIRVGMALKEIHDNKLYRGKYTTWPDYLKKEWDMGRRMGDYQIAASEVIQNLEKWHHGATFEEYSFEFILPKNERQARPLTLLSKERQPEAWMQTLHQTNGKVTALAATKAVQDILEAQLEDEKQGIQKSIIKEVSIPDDFSEQFTRLTEILSMHQKTGWKDFNRKKALEFVQAIEKFLKS